MFCIKVFIFGEPFAEMDANEKLYEYLIDVGNGVGE